ncbi:MAG: DNA alkylation repair protein [Chitinophagaceae bacterium]|nr:DNA alkylation repair protein [Chitinophagaceae bacterium]
MSQLLKDLYTNDFLNNFAGYLQRENKSLSPAQFTRQVTAGNWAELELKQRMKRISTVLHQYMPADFGAASQVLVRLIERLEADGFRGSSIEFIFLPDYIETYGIDDYNTAVAAMERCTCFMTCEFAVRPFLKKYGMRMVKQMDRWSRHSHAHVRRLSSEGMRPRLPWAMAVDFLKKDPSCIIPILERLKNDPEEFVRRSVANNINDIAKDHPDTVLKLIREWKGFSEQTDALLKHGSRTLFKKGHPEVLKLFGWGNNKDIQLLSFTLPKASVKIGNALPFSVQLRNKAAKSHAARIEYAIYYRLKKGDFGKKVFKVSETSIAPGNSLLIERQHSFRPITTRVYYPGAHEIAIIVNGVELDRKPFKLLK